MLNLFSPSEVSTLSENSSLSPGNGFGVIVCLFPNKHCSALTHLFRAWCFICLFLSFQVYVALFLFLCSGTIYKQILLSLGQQGLCIQFVEFVISIYKSALCAHDYTVFSDYLDYIPCAHQINLFSSISSNLPHFFLFCILDLSVTEWQYLNPPLNLEH